MLQLILGPMFSGKTTELVRRMKRYQVAKRSVIVVKYANDTRYDKEMVSTHDLIKMKALSCVKLMGDIEVQVREYDVVGIDEGQFFPDIVQFCELMLAEGKTVVVAALDGTFQRKPFGTLLQLVPLSHSVDKLLAVCMICHKKDAPYTRRLISDTKLEIVGGSEIYSASCEECFEKQVGTDVVENVAIS
jgi:thymidine kinase